VPSGNISAQRAVVVGAGPAGLMAAEALMRAGASVDVYDAMPSVARKFLLAGKGGLNITHSEAFARFLSRYGPHAERLKPWLDRFDPQMLRAWVHELGIQTFVGTSGRVFPAEMKAAPLLRAWLHRLRSGGVRLHVRHRLCALSRERVLGFATPAGEVEVRADAIVLALGGASWPQLGSDAAWVPLLSALGVDIARLRPANCGFDVKWSAHLRERWAGSPVKSVAAWVEDEKEPVRGELLVTEHGVEGGLVYALSRRLREQIDAHGKAVLHLDLAPDRSGEKLAQALSLPRNGRSLSNHLRVRCGIEGMKAALLHEAAREELADGARAAARIKDLPLTLISARPIAEAISSAGGVTLDALDARLMLKQSPGVFCAGEMLDWEAPTGGYLLTACFASGRAAGEGACEWLAQRAQAPA
jgi:uncharacterized flavoprotein (TIGR03862 family)